MYAYQADSHERAQQRGRQDIAHLVDQLAVRPREETIESSHRLYKLALQRGFTRGRRTNQVAAACLYLVCRQDSKPFLLIDFSDSLQVNVFTLGAVFLQLAKLLRLEEHPLFSKPVDPSLYIHRFADRMNFPNRQTMEKVAGTAMRLVASMKRDWIQTGRRPSGVCGAALYIAAHLHGFAKGKREVVEVVHIGEHTLAKRLTEFSSTEAGALTKSQFDTRYEFLEAKEQEALDAATASAAPDGLLTGCEHISMGEEHFQQGMCRACFFDFVKKSGGTYDGANPPAFLKNRIMESKKAGKLLALPAPGDDDEKEEEEEEETEGDDGKSGKKKKKGKKEKEAAKKKKKEKGVETAAALKKREKLEKKNKGEKSTSVSPAAAATTVAVEEETEEAAAAQPSSLRNSRKRHRSGAAAAAATPAAALEPTTTAAAVEEENEEENDDDGRKETNVEAVPKEKITAEMIAAAEKEVESFDAAIAEAEAHDVQKTKRRKSSSAAAAAAAAGGGGMSTADAVAAATEMAIREAAEGAGAQTDEAAVAAAGAIMPSSSSAAAAGAAHQARLPDSTPGDVTTNALSQQNIATQQLLLQQQAARASAMEQNPEDFPEEPENGDAEDDGNLSEISDTDIAMYLADEAEVACKEEIWGLMNQDWVDKQAAKRAALEAAERAQAEQLAAMEAAAAAGIQYKRGRGRPLGSKTKPKPEQNLPPAESAQEAAMRMLDTKKLSSKINYSALADLFSDEPAGAGPSSLGGGAFGGGGGGNDEDNYEDGGDINNNNNNNDFSAPASPHRTINSSILPTPSQHEEGLQQQQTQPSQLIAPSSSAAAAAAEQQKEDGGGGASGSGSGMRPPVSRIAGMTPRAAGSGRPSLGTLNGGGGFGGGASRLGGLNEGLPRSRPLGTSLGGIGGKSGGTMKKSSGKVRFKPGTKLG